MLPGPDVAPDTPIPLGIHHAAAFGGQKILLPAVGNVLADQLLAGAVVRRSIDKIGEIDMPILFLSGLKDELVPPEHMQVCTYMSTSIQLRDGLIYLYVFFHRHNP